MSDLDEGTAMFAAACAVVCPHCAVGNPVRYRPETQEFVHDYAPKSGPIDTPALAQQGGPSRMLPGTFAHVYCAATTLRRAQLPENGAS